MPNSWANINLYSSAGISGLIFENEKTVPYDDTRNSTTWCSWSISHDVVCIRRTARYVVPNQAETAEDAKSTSEHQCIKQCANFRFNIWRRKTCTVWWYQEINHMMFMIDLTWCDMYTTNCEVCGTKSSRNSRRCQKHERTSTYTAVREFPV